VRAEVGKVLKRIEGEHGPPLRALDGEEPACWVGSALQGN
jgi:hypothetical protein